MTTWFEATVKAVGREVEEFLAARTLIFFGPDAPAELQDVSVLLEVSAIDPGSVLMPGRVIEIGESAWTITGVGGAAEENLRRLAHLVLVGDGEEILPGQVRVRGNWPSLKNIQCGAMLRIFDKD